jgi:2-polyprenyl-3-methyl-5-hydroxy-6-metoxy-1,4-benzoquinol methylase
MADPTEGKIDFAAFARLCGEESRRMTRHGADYLRPHVGRLYETFTECLRVVPPGATLLSVGAGGAYVEKQLARTRGALVTVVDFPEAIRQHEPDYQPYGFRSLGVNLAEERLDLGERFDVVLSFEVVEHLPMPPHEHIGALRRLLKPGGRLVLTTPNLAHLPNVVRLLRGRPVLPDARLTFAPPCYENEHVHRREYVAAEIVAAMRQAGLTHERTAYLSCRRRGTLGGCVRRLYDLAPRWKKIMLLVGRRSSEEDDLPESRQ